MMSEEDRAVAVTRILLSESGVQAAGQLDPARPGRDSLGEARSGLELPGEADGETASRWPCPPPRPPPLQVAALTSSMEAGQGSLRAQASPGVARPVGVPHGNSRVTSL